MPREVRQRERLRAAYAARRIFSEEHELEARMRRLVDPIFERRPLCVGSAEWLGIGAILRAEQKAIG